MPSFTKGNKLIKNITKSGIKSAKLINKDVIMIQYTIKII